jgi:hypothetical protein
MGIKDQAKRIGAGAGVALATAGLSNCNDNGAEDPPPPPLECNTVGTGQSLTATATLAADTVNVRVINALHFTWRADRIVDIAGASLVSTRQPSVTDNSLGIVLKLATPATTQAAFTVEATMFGFTSEICAVRRTFNVTITATGVQVSLADVDPLPLAARQRAEIVLASQDGRSVELHARTPWQGERRITWTVSGGNLDATTGSPVRWSLPEAPGIYQAELLIDFGPEGLAFDHLLLEVEDQGGGQG